jgi:hypothetical protein
VRFNVTDQILIKYFAFVRYWKTKWEYNETVHQLSLDFMKAYDSDRREVPMKIVRLIKMCLNETHSRIRIGKQLSYNFLLKNGLKQGIFLLYHHCFHVNILGDNIDKTKTKLHGLSP